VTSHHSKTEDELTAAEKAQTIGGARSQESDSAAWWRNAKKEAPRCQHGHRRSGAEGVSARTGKAWGNYGLRRAQAKSMRASVVRIYQRRNMENAGMSDFMEIINPQTMMAEAS